MRRLLPITCAAVSMTALAAQMDGLYGPTNAYSVAMGETLEIADKSGADATLSAALQAKISFWVDASKNLVTDAGGNLIAWLDARETPVADADAYAARTDWTYPRAITYRSGANSADYPLVKSDVAVFGGKPYVDFGEYTDNKWMLFVDAEGNRKEVSLVGFSGYVGFGRSAGFVLCDVANPDVLADPNGSTGENGRVFYHKGSGSGDGTWDTIYSASYGIGSEQGQNGKYWAETRIDGAIVKPTATLHRRNGWEIFSQNGPTVSINSETPYVTTFFNDCNLKGQYTDRQGGGKIAEMMTFTSVLTQDELDEVEAYLRQKWCGGNTLGAVALADGATLAVSNANPFIVKDVSGAGDIVKSGTGELKIDRNGLLGTGTLTLNDGTVTTYQKRNHLPPLKAVGGKTVSATDRSLSAADAGDAKTFTVNADATGRRVEIGALDAGVEKVAVSKAELAIRPKVAPSAASSAAVNLIQNGSFESDTITANSGAWQDYKGAMTGWTAAAMKSTTSDSGCGLAKHGSPWVNDSTDTAVPDGVQCAFFQIKGANSTNGISQTVTTTNGLYKFSSWIRCRNRSSNDYKDSSVLFVLVVDGKTMLVRRTSNRGRIKTDTFYEETKTHLNFQKAVAEIALGAGEHTIQLLGAMPSDMASTETDRALDIDDVRLELVKVGSFVQIPDPGFSSCVTHMTAADQVTGLFTQDQDSTPFWTFAGSAGMARYESIWYWVSDPAIEDEDQEAYLQTKSGTPQSTISTTVTLPKSGRARLSLRYANRSRQRNVSTQRPSGQTVSVTLGGAEIFSATVTSESMVHAFAEVDVTAGEQALVLSSSGDASADRATIVDDIRIEYVEDDGEILRDADFADNTTVWTRVNIGQDNTSVPGLREAVFFGLHADDASMSQTIAIPTDGAYMLRFQSRGLPLYATGHTGAYHGCTFYVHTLEVYVDGALLASVYNSDAERHAVEMRLPYLTAGAHMIEFRGAAQQPNIDCQSRISCPEIVPLATGAAADWSNTKIELTDGAKLNLDFAGTIRSGSVTIGGNRVTSGTITAQKYPSYVTGAGTLEVVSRGMIISIH